MEIIVLIIHKNNMKKILLLFAILILTSCTSGSPMGGDTIDKISIEKEILQIEKEQEKEKTGKYKFKEKYEKEGIFYTVNEYDAPPYDKDSKGYQIIVDDGKKLTGTGYGVNAKDYDFEYSLPIQDPTFCGDIPEGLECPK